MEDNKLKLKVERYEFTDTQTWGRFYIDGEPFCDTLEDKDRNLEECGCEAKIYAKTAIPRGTYKVTLYYWPKYRNWYGLLQNVPCFTGIFIHGGWNEIDSAGCILIGTRHGNHLENCGLKVQRLRDSMIAARDLDKTIEIEII